MDDVVSDVLQLLRLKGCVYFLRDFWSPWGMAVDDSPFAPFHYVVRGACVVELNDRAVRLDTGDVVVFPRGTSHVFSDTVGRPSIDGRQVLESFTGPAPLFATGEVPSRVLCGHFELARDLPHPLLDDLPAVIHIPAFDQLVPQMMPSLTPLLLRELADHRPGARVVVERLAEILLVQVLRHHVLANPQKTGFMAAAADPRVHRALAMIHARWPDRLTVDDLAGAAGMSRSSFAEHFKSVAGTSPITYLTHWRMLQAKELLDTSRLSIAEIAERVGYDSDIAFSRAFKRVFAASPARFRRHGKPVATTP